MNNVIIEFLAGETEYILEEFDTNKNALTGIIIHGNVLENTSISFERQSNALELNQNTFFPYRDYEGNIIQMPLYSNSWLGINPYIDLLSVINKRSRIKFTLNQAQTEAIKLELLFFINVI